MDDCIQFRSLLESELLRPGANEDLVSLSWHEHLLSCEGCRELLAAEEALELLLSSLPQPQLPKHLVRRVLLRLRSVRSAPALDRLLEIDSDPQVPVALSKRLLEGLAEARFAGSDRLDDLLDRYEVQPEPELATRVLRALGDKRIAVPVPFYQRSWIKVTMATAAAALVYWGSYLYSSEQKALHSPLEVALADDALLEDYYILENWTLLMPESDVEVLLATSIAPADEIAMSLDEEE